MIAGLCQDTVADINYTCSSFCCSELDYPDSRYRSAFRFVRASASAFRLPRLMQLNGEEHVHTASCTGRTETSSGCCTKRSVCLTTL
jgi:hypothetical protein